MLTDLRTEMLALQRELTARAIASHPDDPMAGVDAFLNGQAMIVSRVRSLIPETPATPSASALAVVSQALTRLRPRGGIRF